MVILNNSTVLLEDKVGILKAVDISREDTLKADISKAGTTSSNSQCMPNSSHRSKVAVVGADVMADGEFFFLFYEFF